MINEIPCRLIYVDGTSRRIDRAKLRIIEVRAAVKPRTRPHPSRVIPLKTFPSTRASAEGGGCSGKGCKSFCKI